MTRAHHEVARAVQRRIARHGAEIDRGLEQGVVTALDPLTLELTSGATQITIGDDFYLTQVLEWWHVNYGIAVGDVLLLLRDHTGKWTAFDIRSERSVEGGLRMARPAATVVGDVREYDATHTEVNLFSVDQPTGNVTWHHHIVGVAPAYTKEGVFLGYVPIFGSLPS